jgi:hypothetical protein
VGSRRRRRKRRGRGIRESHSRTLRLHRMTLRNLWLLYKILMKMRRST